MSVPPPPTVCTVNIIFSKKLTRRVLKVWAPEMISTYIEDHNLGAQPCKSTTGNWQEANNVVITEFFLSISLSF